MNNCKFNPENTGFEDGTAIQCPDCGHWVVAGLPHPDFNSSDLPVPEDELTKLSQGN